MHGVHGEGLEMLGTRSMEKLNVLHGSGKCVVVVRKGIYFWFNPDCPYSDYDFRVTFFLPAI